MGGFPASRSADGNCLYEPAGQWGPRLGSKGGSVREAFRVQEVLDESGLQSSSKREPLPLGGSRSSIAVKPTFMFGYHHKDYHPANRRSWSNARYINDCGCTDIAVVNSSIYDHFYLNRAAADVALIWDSTLRFTELSTSRRNSVTLLRSRLGQYSVSRTWKKQTPSRSASAQSSG